MVSRCNFCNIGSEPDRIIRRTNAMTSFLSNPRLVIGHALVVPNRHITLPSELSDEEIVATFREASRLTEVMLGGMALGTDIWQKSRPQVAEGPIKQDHIHAHVLPSVPGMEVYDRGINWGEGDWRSLELDEMALMVGLLR